jgi:hypothetical protein
MKLAARDFDTASYSLPQSLAGRILAALPLWQPAHAHIVPLYTVLGRLAFCRVRPENCDIGIWPEWPANA